MPAFYEFLTVAAALVFSVLGCLIYFDVVRP